MADDWKERLAQILDPVPSQEDNECIAAIREFVSELSKNKWVHAELRAGTLPPMWNVVTGPKVRRDMDSLMLTFWLESAGVRALGSERKLLSSREEVLQYLTWFVTETAFPMTLAEYRRICEQPTPGQIRWREGEQLKKVDVLVDQDSQRSLAEQSRLGADATLTVKAALQSAGELPQTGMKLISGGFGLRVISFIRNGDVAIHCVGDVISPADIYADNT